MKKILLPGINLDKLREILLSKDGGSKKIYSSSFELNGGISQSVGLVKEHQMNCYLHWLRRYAPMVTAIVHRRMS